MINVGVRLRQLRKKRNISLLELSKATGMGYSFLSGLENNKYSITIANLQKLSDFFGMNLIYFLQDEEEYNIKVIHLDEMEKYRLEDGMVFGVLTPSNSQFVQASRVHLPKFSNKKPTMHNHSKGEEVLIILSGTLNVNIGSKEYELHQGDSIYFDSSYEHCMYTEGRDSEFILISSPPVEIHGSAI